MTAPETKEATAASLRSGHSFRRGEGSRPPLPQASHCPHTLMPKRAITPEVHRPCSS
jgi:hypothetical protein